jgi:anthranilate synthase component II
LIKNKVLLVDNYDSFTYNLKHALESKSVAVDVVLEKDLDLLSVKKYDRIILSPGPGLPSEAPKMLALIQEYYTQKPILGVCLGMQAIAVVFGAELRNLTKVKHGVSEQVKVDKDSLLFCGISPIIEVGLYHSWCVLLNDSQFLKPLAWSFDGVLMAFKHHDFPIYGVQFHPESIMSLQGTKVLDNFLNL